MPLDVCDSRITSPDGSPRVGRVRPQLRRAWGTVRDGCVDFSDHRVDMGRSTPSQVLACVLAAVVAVACAGGADAPGRSGGTGVGGSGGAGSATAGNGSDDAPPAESPDDEVAAPEVEQEAPDALPGGADGGEGGGSTDDLAVYYLDVGQGDATLLVHDEVAMLIDAGRWQASDVVPFLRSRGVESLDLVVITHPHADHIGQFDQVMDAFDVEEVWWSGSATTSQTFERSIAALERSDARYEEPRSGDVASIGPLLLEVVNPPVGVDVGDLHDANLAVRITYGEVRFLFTGDAERATEARMVAEVSTTLAADILQLGHHGSRTSTTPAFLAAVDPSVAIYSAGDGNSYGHPHGSVLDRLRDAGVSTYGTDVHGSITVRTDGATWTIGTEREE